MQSPRERQSTSRARAAPRRLWLGARRRAPGIVEGNLAPQFPLNGSPQRRIVSALRRHTGQLPRRADALNDERQSAPTLRRDGLPEKARAVTPRQPQIAPGRGQPPRAPKAAPRARATHRTL